MAALSTLSEIVGAAFADIGLDPELGVVVASDRPDLADFQSNGAMAAARAAGRSPREIAQDVVERLAGDPRLAAAEVAGPGFINLTLADATLAEWVEEAGADDRLGVAPADPAETVLVDYAGPNVAKAMHVGHLRATIIGDSIARIMALLGHDVIRDPHFGDWGYQMGLIIAELESRHPDWAYFDETSDGPFPNRPPVTLSDLEEVYPAATARAAIDPEFAEAAGRATVALQGGRPGYLALWKHMREVSLEAQRRNFSDLGVDFDVWYGESDVADLLSPLVERLRETGVAEDSQGAVIVRVDRPEDNRDIPPLLLVNSRGAYLYSTTDVATIWYRVDKLGADRILYVVDARQSDHFLQVFRAAERAGLCERTELEHITFGTMNGPDGRPFRTREGGVVSLRDLIEMVEEAAFRRLDETGIAAGYPKEERADIAHKVGIAALKFGDLIVNRSSDYLFDLDRFSSFEGKTGPYLQYAAVRMRSLLARAADRGLERGPIQPPGVDQERALLLGLLGLPDAVARAAQLRAPNHVAEYAFDLAGRFNRFYDVCHVLNEEDPIRRAGWLSLVSTTLDTLVLTLDLLGIEVPARM